MKKIILLLILYSTTNSAIAATFTVTQSFGCGPGSIVDAVHQANITPGKDTINFAPGVTVLKFNCDGDAQLTAAQDYFLLWISESVDIVGHSSTDKVTVDGEISWISSNGYLRPLDCPSNSFFTGVNIREFPGFIRIGTQGANNSNIEVNVKNMVIQNMNAFAQVYENATLKTLDSELLGNADSKWCNRAMIYMKDGSVVNLNHTTVKHNQILSEDEQWVLNGFIFMEGHTNLTIQDSYFSDNHGGGAVSALGTLNIISSLFEDSGGIEAFNADLTVVNSAFITGLSPGTGKESMH